MKKRKNMLAVLLAAVTLSTCAAGCGSPSEGGRTVPDKEEGQELPEQETGEVSAPEDSSQEAEVSIQEQVLLEQEGLKITAKELTEDSIWGPAVAVLIENSGQQDVTVQIRNMSVNGIMADPMFSCEVAAGKSANDTITLMSSSLEAAGITTIQNMEFSFHIFDTESWDTIVDTEMIRLATSADGTQEQTVNNSGTKVLEQDGISITIQELDSEESFWGADVYVYIENNSSRNITVQARSVSINGFMVEPIFSPEVVAGKKAFNSITFMESDLSNNGITSIDEMEISFHVFETESMDTILDSEPVVVTFTP